MMKEINIPEWLIKFEELCKEVDLEIEKEKIEIIKQHLEVRTKL